MLYSNEALVLQIANRTLFRGGGGYIEGVRGKICLRYSKSAHCLNTVGAHCSLRLACLLGLGISALHASWCMPRELHALHIWNTYYKGSPTYLAMVIEVWQCTYHTTKNTATRKQTRPTFWSLIIKVWFFIYSFKLIMCSLNKSSSISTQFTRKTWNNNKSTVLKVVLVLKNIY